MNRITEKQKEWHKTINTMQNRLAVQLPDGYCLTVGVTNYASELMRDAISVTLCVWDFDSCDTFKTTMVSNVQSDTDVIDFLFEAEKYFKEFLESVEK